MGAVIRYQGSRVATMGVAVECGVKVSRFKGSTDGGGSGAWC